MNPAASSPEDRLVMKVTAGLLAGGQTLTLAAHFATLFTLLGWWLGSAPAPPIAGWIWAGGLLLWPFQCWLGFRLAVDAALFRSLDPDPAELAAFDARLEAWGLSAPRAPRNAEQRGEGAIRLLRRHGQLLVWQFMTLALGLVIRFLG